MKFLLTVLVCLSSLLFFGCGKKEALEPQAKINTPTAHAAKEEKKTQPKPKALTKEEKKAFAKKYDFSDLEIEVWSDVKRNNIHVELVSDLSFTSVAVKHEMTEAVVEKIYMKVKHKWFDDRLERHFVSTKQKAETGDVDVQFKLGSIYYSALAPGGGGCDWKEAIKWWLKAAQEGHVEAQQQVGAAIIMGYGVKADPKVTGWPKWEAELRLARITGYGWCQIAENNGHPDAKIVKEQYSKNMTAEEIEKAEALTKEMVIKNPKLTKK